MDYQTRYNDYWNQLDCVGSSFDDSMDITRSILQVSGPSHILDIGSGMGKLVLALLQSGCDASGVDVSPVAVAQANNQAPGRYQVASALKLPFSDNAFTTVVSTHFLECLSESDVPTALAEIWRVCEDTLFLQLSTTFDQDERWKLTAYPREWWEQQLFAAGFRKHPAQQEITGYETLEDEGNIISLVMQKIPATVIESYPLSKLIDERDLHMDMTREPGRRSDAHIARYVLARQFVKPGDTVLDIACGLGYGSSLLAHRSAADRVIGVDNSDFAIKYAKTNFQDDRHRVNFHCGDGTDLNWLADNSVDYVISMETLEHLPDPLLFLKEIKRILKPSGRLIVSVPNLWIDETGEDPNPHHLHVYDLKKLRAQIGDFFLVEDVWSQIAGGGFKLSDCKRKIHQIDTSNETLPDAEWWLALAIQPLTEGDSVAYIETVHPGEKLSDSHIADFASWYENPWLINGLVNRGSRLHTPELRRSACNQVLKDSPKTSADRGAALCVLAYDVLENQFNVEYPASLPSIDELSQQTQTYLDVDSRNPHITRWQTSLSYVIALLEQSRGNLQQAEHHFKYCLKLDPLPFSPLLATKTMASALALAQIYRSRGQRDQAQSVLTDALSQATRVIGQDWENVVGDVKMPLTFGMYEIAEVCDLAAKCAFEAEGLNRGWSNSFTSIRGRISHLDTIKDSDYANKNLHLTNQSLAGQIEYLRSTVSERDLKILNLENSQSEWTEKEAELYARLKDSIEYASQLADRTTAMEASRSWKITAPIRSLGQRTYRLRRLYGRFADNVRTRGIGTALSRTTQYLRRSSKHRQPTRLPAPELSPLKRQRRRPTIPQISNHNPVAMLVGDFEDGGLEKVVMDLALQFQHKGVECPILVVNSVGRAANHAIDLGCDVQAFHGDVAQLVELVKTSKIEAIFTHHCYEAVEQLGQSGAKLIEVIHNAYHWQRNEPWVSRLRQNYFAKLVGVSDFVTRYTVEQLDIATNQIQTIENGLSREGLIRPPLPLLTEKRQASMDAPLLVHLANAHPQKNHIAIFRAFLQIQQQFPEARLVFAGVIDEGTETGRKLLTEIQQSGIQASVELSGPLNRRELSRLLARAHVGLLPSAVEGFSIASLEFSYFALPTVLSATGASEWLADRYGHVSLANQAALLPIELAPAAIEARSINPHEASITSIAEAIKTILLDYEIFSKAASKAGEKWKEYSIENVSKRYLDLVKEVVQ